ncbi:MAG: tRNA (adenosine(37)-N6)-threonylcarbamoyltransferase complex transferase subunit TsaD [Pseudomonadota bacterium]
MIVLGIETSCDETAAAVVERTSDRDGAILSNVVLSQLEEHRAFGGVVPEIAARAHVSALDGVVQAALEDAGRTLEDVDAIAATAGPGLIGGLLVGTVTAKALALGADKPFVVVNHLEGHALTALLTDQVKPPFLLLLVSGGHSELILVEEVGVYARLGATIDDAAGEAFDKTAKLLGLPYPGGPQVERHAACGDPSRFALPRPLKGRPGADFSFAGLKTALRVEAERCVPLTDRDIEDLCAGFQAALVECLTDRTCNAMETVSDRTQGRCDTLVVAGGVAANTQIRSALTALADKQAWRFAAPPLTLCGDNAVMIAWAGALRFARGQSDGFDAPAHPRWPLEDLPRPDTAA